MAESVYAGTGSLTVDRLAELDEPGRISRWLSRDWVRATAILVILIGLAWRTEIASRGYLALDDFALATRSAVTALTPDYLLTLFNNHLMPGGLLTYWLLTRATGLAYWPYLVLIVIAQAATSFAFYRLLRLVVRPGWGVLVPLCIFLFSPISLESTSWVAVAVNVVPMQLAMVLALGAQVKYIRTGRRRHLVTLAASVVFGLLFFEKSLLIVPLVFGMTACFFVRGGPVRSVVRAFIRYWPSWAVLGVISAGYLAFYATLSTSALRAPQSPGEVATFLGQLFGSTLIPGLLGGPWGWLQTGDGPPLVDSGEVLRWLAWAVFLAVVVITTGIRRSAGRAWVLFVAYSAMVAVLLSATRLGAVLSPWAGLVPRYVSDVVIVAALCVGVALLGVAEPAPVVGRASTPPLPPLPPTPPAWGAVRRNPAVAAAGLILAVVSALALGVGTAWSGARYGDGWSVKHGRDYLVNAQADLATAKPGTVFFDELVPATVVEPYWFPDTLLSHFFRPAIGPKPTYVTETDNLFVLDDLGHVRSARIVGRSITPGPTSCGYEIHSGPPVVMPLDGPIFEWGWTVRVAYLSSGETTATFRLGNATRRFDVHQGLHQIFFLLAAGGERVELSVDDPNVSMCTNAISVGNTEPGL